MSQSTVFVYTLSRAGKIGAWSLYQYPMKNDEYAQLGDDLYVRSENAVFKVDRRAFNDQLVDGSFADVNAVIRWPYLDCGSPGQEKEFEGIDIVGNGTCTIQVGANQRDQEEMTTPYPAVADTLTGSIVPFPMSGPSFSLQLNFSTADNPDGWEWMASNLYVIDNRGVR